MRFPLLGSFLRAMSNLHTNNNAGKPPRFDTKAAWHYFLLYHVIAGIDELNFIFGNSIEYQYDTSRDAMALLPAYLRRSLAAFLLGGHIGGTAKRHFFGGDQPVVGGSILFIGQLFTLWSLLTGVIIPELLPSISVFFCLIGVATLWTCYVQVEDFVSPYKCWLVSLPS